MVDANITFTVTGDEDKLETKYSFLERRNSHLDTNRQTGATSAFGKTGISTKSVKLAKAAPLS